MMSKTIKPSHPENLLNDRELDLRCRLAQAMLKAGFSDDAVSVTSCLDTGSHDDVSSIIVFGETTTRARAAEWIKKALDQAGVEMTRSGGSWGRGINAIGPVKVVHGEYASRVECHYSSIGELVNVTFTREKV